MQDNLKQFVEDHHEDLEVYHPRESLWEGISERIQGRRAGVRWQRLAMASSIVLALTCGTWIFIAGRQQTANELTTTDAQAPITQAEAYFTALVHLKDEELEQYCTPQPELCREFETDIEALNEAYHQLRKEYAGAADKQAILKAMANNLQMQVQLISRQLQIMESVQQKKEEFKII